MPRGGSKPGERRGGRRRGTPNKATLERRAKAQIAIMQERDAPIEQRELAKDALMRIAQVAEGAAAVNRPTLQSEIANGATPNPDGDWDRYKGFLQLSLFGYKAAADFQSPKMLAVATAPPPPPETAEVEHIELRVFEGGREIKVIEHQPERSDAA